MKMVIALVSRYRIDEISKALTGIGVQGMTLVEVKCYSGISGEAKNHAGMTGRFDCLPKVKIEVVVPDEKLDELVRMITREEMDKDIGMDKVCVLDLQDSIRIRNGQREGQFPRDNEDDMRT